MNAGRDESALALVSAYFELASDAVDVALARELSISFARIADVERLFAVGRVVRDPFPWVPFLRQLSIIPEDQRSTRSDDARDRLYASAKKMLEQQQLGLVRPEDLLARSTPFEAVLTELSSPWI